MIELDQYYNHINKQEFQSDENIFKQSFVEISKYDNQEN